MKFIFWIILIGTLVIGIALLEKDKSMDKLNSTLTVAMPQGWGPLNPPQQSTYMAAEILGNIYETLVAYDLQGNLRPLLASSWEVSDDLRVYSFRLDTSRKFSNGEGISSTVVKKAWEHALTVPPASSNRSPLDLLYLVEGFENFENTKVLNGIETPSESTLTIRFKKPVRQALSFLAGARYGIYILTTDGRYLGTGSYQFNEMGENEVFLSFNPYTKEKPPFPKVRIIGTKSREMDETICNLNPDVIWFSSSVRSESCSNNQISFFSASGAYASHLMVAVNGTNGRLLADPQLRRALQYLVLSRSRDIVKIFYDSKDVEVSSQFLLPVQVGHLPTDEAESMVNEGGKWVSRLIRATQEHPLQFWIANEKHKRVAEVLIQTGIRLKLNNCATPEDYRNLYYKTHDYDILLSQSGFGSIDPDGLYHLLGKYGAITTPAIGRKRVWEILEKGRSVLQPKELNKVYGELSQVILTEVPAIHLASSRPTYFFNSKRVRLEDKSINSPRFNFNAFKTVF